MIIDAATAEELKKTFAGLTEPVKLVLFKENLLCRTCGPAEDLLRETAALSDKINLEIHNRVTEEEKAAEYGASLTPSIFVESPASGRRVRFNGIPAGYEFVSLIEAILAASAGKADLQAETLSALAGLKGPVNIKVFVTPDCPYCPSAVMLAHKFAIASSKVTAEMVEVEEFRELAAKYEVQGVPKLVINDRMGLVGAQPESMLLKAVVDSDAAGEGK
ncbi:MAG: glutaredoxin-like domain-containing protein [Elusimicrobia bacterium]|nr:MAG: glutaredoxin-like domain-containing protein [Elusimicrobiota bacterium]KAF0154146.1 MAG: glutaredoxin-like domain-containing protein [Elusimicrobiota bacterium]